MSLVKTLSELEVAVSRRSDSESVSHFLLAGKGVLGGDEPELWLDQTKFTVHVLGVRSRMRETGEAEFCDAPSLAIEVATSYADYRANAYDRGYWGSISVVPNLVTFSHSCAKQVMQMSPCKPAFYR